MLNPNNTSPKKLSEAPPEAVENKLAEKSWIATVFGLIQVSAFLAWFYWAYCGYMRWYSFKQGTLQLKPGEVEPTLPETGIVKVGIPLFLIAIFVEFVVSHLLGEHENYRAAETVSNFSNGLMQQMVEMWTTMLGEWFGLVLITAVPYKWIYENFAITNALEGNLLGFVFMWFARDFGYYWFHRAAHRSAFMWAVHGVHHIPNEFNYSVNLSQGAIQRITSAAFYAPLALFCPPELYIIIFPMEKIYGFFTHTRLVSKMYYISAVFVTPSTHRVHHAGAPSKYIDKNYGEMLTIWDRMFGTHEEEVEPVVFGHVHPHDKWNPVDCQMAVWKGIWAKAQQCSNIFDKFLCFVLPPGWDPINGGEYPLVDSTPYSALKYDSSLPWSLTGYLVVWFTFSLGFGIFLVRMTHSMTLLGNVLLFLYVLGSIFSLGALSDRNPRSVAYEMIRLFHAPFVLYVLGSAYKFDDWIVWNATVLTALASIVSVAALIAHGDVFVQETEKQRSERVWIREAGRNFTKALQNDVEEQDYKKNGFEEPWASKRARSIASPKMSSRRKTRSPVGENGH